MDLTQLKYFQAAARTGNITRAAAELYVSQPNLSKSITRLEEELGVPLFDHRKGKIELNDYGRMFLSSVDIAFSELSAGVQNIQRMYAASQFVLSLGCNIRSYLADNLPAFSSSHPEIGIRQLDCTTPQLIDLLLDRSINLALSNEKLVDERIDFRLLGSKHYVIALHADHPLANRNSASFAQLKDDTFICDTSRFHLDNLRQVCQKHGFLPHVGYEIQSTDLVYGLLEANRGVAVIPIAMGCHMIDAHPSTNIRLLSIEDSLSPVIIGIGTLNSQPFSQAAQLFQDFLTDVLAEEEALIHKLGYDALA